MEPEKSTVKRGNHLNQTFIFWVLAVTLQEVSVQALEFHPVFPFALPQVATVAFGRSHLERTVRCVFLGCEARVFVSGTVDGCLGNFFRGLHRDYFLIKQEFIGLIVPYTPTAPFRFGGVFYYVTH